MKINEQLAILGCLSATALGAAISSAGVTSAVTSAVTSSGSRSTGLVGRANPTVASPPSGFPRNLTALNGTGTRPLSTGGAFPTDLPLPHHRREADAAPPNFPSGFPANLTRLNGTGTRPLSTGGAFPTDLPLPHHRREADAAPPNFPSGFPANLTRLIGTAPGRFPFPTGSASPSGFFQPVRRQVNSAAAPAATQTAASGGFVAYSGPASNFPPVDQWKSFDDLWNQNVPQMKKAGNSDDENDQMKSDIQTVAKESGVDERAILATIMQESTGNIRAPDTKSGVPDAANAVPNRGLMQSHNGVAFNPADPKGSIFQMIKDGSEGTSSGEGLKQTLADQGGNYYEAFRKYNSGSVDKADLNVVLGSTTLYVQQIANRLLGASPTP
jgi:hypothetical protein